MKNIPFLILFLFGISFFQSACRKKGCVDLGADNPDLNAKKDDGSCIYSATSYLGNYHVADIEIDTLFTDTLVRNYDIKISASSGNGVRILNFNSTGDSIGALIRKGQIDFDLMSFPSQIYYQGSGACNGDTIKWNYNINHGDRLVSGICIRY